MSIQKNKELIQRYVEEVYKKQDLDAYLNFVHGDKAQDGADHLQQFFTAFPDSQVTVLDLFGEDDKVVARLRINATHKGPFAGQPPTGKKVQFDSIRIYRIIDGKIVDTWAMQDRLGLMEQLGFIQAVGEVNWAAGDKD
jgi:predicted ester cyclase